MRRPVPPAPSGGEASRGSGPRHSCVSVRDRHARADGDGPEWCLVNAHDPSPDGSLPPAGPLRPANDPVARRARWAVSLIFFLHGASFCALLPRYPELVASIALSNTAFGLAVGLGPIGGLLSGLFAARLMSRFGSARVAVDWKSLV